MRHRRSSPRSELLLSGGSEFCLLFLVLFFALREKLACCWMRGHVGAGMGGGVGSIALANAAV